MREPVELAKAYRLLNHGPVTLVSSTYGGKSNVMAASWAMPLDFNPAKIVVVIDKSTLTRKLIEASGEFVLNIPCRAMANKVLRAGSISGEDGDKFAITGLNMLAGEAVEAPLVDGCVAWLECRIIPEPHNQQTYDLFIGEVVAASADPRVFRSGRWHFAEDGSTDDLRTLHYVAGGSFFETGRNLVIDQDEEG